MFWSYLAQRDVLWSHLSLLLGMWEWHASNWGLMCPYFDLVCVPPPPIYRYNHKCTVLSKTSWIILDPVNASASYFSTMISAFVWHLVCHCSHWLGGKVNWHWVGAQGQTGNRPEQMAASFTCNTTQWPAVVEITPLSNNKKNPWFPMWPLQCLQPF